MEFAEIGGFVRGKLGEHAHFQKLLKKPYRVGSNHAWLHEIHLTNEASENDVRHVASFVTALMLKEGFRKAEWKTPEVNGGLVKSERFPSKPGFEVFADARIKRVLIWDYSHDGLLRLEWHLRGYQIPRKK